MSLFASRSQPSATSALPTWVSDEPPTRASTPPFLVDVEDVGRHRLQLPLQKADEDLGRCRWRDAEGARVHLDPRGDAEDRRLAARDTADVPGSPITTGEQHDLYVPVDEALRGGHGVRHRRDRADLAQNLDVLEARAAQAFGSHRATAGEPADMDSRSIRIEMPAQLGEGLSGC